MVVNYNPERINHILGKNIPAAEQMRILQALQMQVNQQYEGWAVTVPGYKIDVLREIDLAEEIARIYGMNNIPAATQFRYGMQTQSGVDPYLTRESALNFLAASGFNEIMNLSVINSDNWIRNSGFVREQGVLVNNTSNVQLDLMRPSLLASALETVSFNAARQQPDLRIFEFGREYSLQNGQSGEDEKLALAITGKYWAEGWQKGAGQSAGIYILKSVVLNLCDFLGITEVKEVLEGDHIHIRKGKVSLGEVYAVPASMLKSLGIRQDVYFAVLDWKNVMAVLSDRKQGLYAEFSKYPSVRRDLALVMDEQVSYEEIARLIRSETRPYLQSVNLFDEYRSEEHLGPGKKSYAISMVLSNPDKTWSEKELDGIMQGVIDKLKQRYNISIRK